MTHAVQAESVGLADGCWWLTKLTCATSSPEPMTPMLVSLMAESVVVP
jgi:hypothetical protein